MRDEVREEVREDVAELARVARQVVEAQGIAPDATASAAQFAELGWLLVAVPEERGGLGLGLSGACALLQAAGRGLGTAPLLPSLLAVEAVCRSEAPGMEALLARLTTGELYAAASLVTPGLERDAGGGLSGIVAAVPDADRAGAVLVWSAQDDCVALLPVSTAAACGERPTWDVTRRLFDLHFEGVTPRADQLLASGPAARSLVARLECLRDFGVASDAAGGAAALLALTVDYLQTRRQFGRPLAMFQALKHRCADLAAACEAADAMLWDHVVRADRASRVRDGLDEARRLAAAAKALACATYAEVAEEAVQLHGGIAMTAEHVCHRYLKRAMLNEHLGLSRDGCERLAASPWLAAAV